MTYDLEGKSVIVTGAGRGLAQAMTIGLAQAGASIIALDIEEDKLAETMALAAKSGVDGHIKPHGCDVASVEACEVAVAFAIKETGGLQGLINCAGLGMAFLDPDFHAKPIRFWEADTTRWQQIIDVNLRGPFLMARAAAPHMLAQKWGRIINVTTSFNTMIRGANMPYGQTKAGLEAATNSWSEDMEGTGVTANVLIPGGAADTRMIPFESPYDRSKLVSPQAMVAPAQWLMSDLSDGVTGKRFIGRDWDPAANWRDAMQAAGSPVAWPKLAGGALSGQPAKMTK
jgi:NAD(P)-dependent dehydrogenase (short-subunit alcohol dehydrogenase family)